MKTIRHVEIIERIYETEEERDSDVKEMKSKGYFVESKDHYNINRNILNPLYVPYAHFAKFCEAKGHDFRNFGE